MRETESSLAPRTGYSTQTTIALAVADSINNGRIHFWCASVINPLHNALSSNPLAIFAELSRFICGGRSDHDLDKVTTVQANLVLWVHRMAGHGIDSGVRNETLAAIKEAFQERSFQPKIYRLSDLARVQDREESDEFIATNEPWKSSRIRSMRTVDLDQDL